METHRHASLFSWVAAAALALSSPLPLHPGYAQDDPAVVLAAGDIARCGSPGAEATARLLDRLPGTILALGDLVYEGGSHEDFRSCYEPTWGRHRDRTRPVPGNHEYRTPGAEGYFGYWGARAGPAGRGFYSFDLGAWHIVALNSSVDAAAGSAQERWLRRDLAATAARCLLAFWHHPVFSSGRYGGNPKVRALSRALHEAGATLVLAGHDHDYERFAPQDPEGRPDARRGFRAFTVGTGGARLRSFQTIQANSEFRAAATWGVLRLTLGPAGYAWEFITVKGETIDGGRGPCVARPAG